MAALPVAAGGGLRLDAQSVAEAEVLEPAGDQG